jgi:UDP-GlcNAc:undecaprenyl-phosphate GlcNAc-1-phosphate transferase
VGRVQGGIMAFVVSGLLGLCLTLILMPALIWVALRIGLLDNPGRRKVHTAPVPVCGGIGMACGALLASLAWWPLPGPVQAYWAGALILVTVGVIDDFRSLHYLWRLLWQIAAALLIAGSGVAFRSLPLLPEGVLPPWLAFAATVVFIVAVTNAVNLFDGLDGLAGGCTLLSLLGVGVLAAGGGAEAAAVLATALIGSIFGFLRYNTHPASVFMGDAGSTFLGFTLAVTALMTLGGSAEPASPLILLPLIGLPLIDTAKVVVERLLHGRSPFAADRRHLHHKLLALGFAHHEVVVLLYLIHGLMVLSAVGLHREPAVLTLPAYAVWCAAVIVPIEWAAARGLQCGPEWPLRIMLARRSRWLRERRWLPTAGSAVLAYAVAAFPLIGAAAPDTVPAAISLPALCLAVVLLLERRLAAAGLQGVFKMALFAAVILLGYVVTTQPPSAALPPWWIPGYGIGLLALLAVAVRAAGREVFPVTPHDILMVLIIVGAFCAMLGGFVERAAIGPLIASVALLYGCEFVLRAGHSRIQIVKIAAVLALVIVGTRALLA